MFVLYSVLSGRGICDGPIPRPEESYRLWCVPECDQVKINNLDRHLLWVGKRGNGYDDNLMDMPYINCFVYWFLLKYVTLFCSKTADNLKIHGVIRSVAHSNFCSPVLTAAGKWFLDRGQGKTVVTPVILKTNSIKPNYKLCRNPVARFSLL
jgi:hypothetical protein